MTDTLTTEAAPVDVTGEDPGVTPAGTDIGRRPPKAAPEEAADWAGRSLDDAIARSFEIIDGVMASFPIVGTYWLFSGGNDSVILGHLLRGRYDGVLHVNTGTGVPETSQHVRDVAAAWGERLHELRPKNSYADLVMGRVIAATGPNAGKRAVWRGFPGPPGHRVMYRHLKDEPLMRFRRSVVGTHGRTRKVAFLGGMRWAESDRRWRNAEAVDPDGAIVWTSPLVHWTNEHMKEYRSLHRCSRDHTHALHRLCFDGALPLNEVTEHLHMSAECLCGAYAKPGELEEIEFFYPHAAEPLRALEREANAAGIEGCRWGRKPPPGTPDGDGEQGPGGRLCSSCELAPGEGADPLDRWLELGLITAEQHADLTGVPAEVRASVAGSAAPSDFGWLSALLPPPVAPACPQCRTPMALGAIPLLWECPRCEHPAAPVPQPTHDEGGRKAA
ncbi:phosphoadenosine phosphosulfate reductase family protein [Embleya sp. NPDC050154]|uniref:phosphoadenosine phosphosulfate reductase domain-containing protein n=1 Tax=Embleya sp. NPDC050154 TaxID=3363988 RepID=UPI0037A6A3E1